MGNVAEQVREIQLRILEDMKKRRDVLDKGIAELEHAVGNPTLPIHVGFEAIEEEARRDMEFLEKCERIRKGEWVNS